MNIKEIVNQMTLEEKASLMSGLDFWQTKPIERLGIPSIMLSDGPHGLRKQMGSTDNVGIGESVPSTCFPAACTLACSWDEDLLYMVGKALGYEARCEEIGIVLGPGVNIKRSPLCGRNFEYFSEDPLLAGKLASSYILGVQENEVGTSLKHFAVNNQEFNRISVDVKVSRRALMEIYLRAFEIAIKTAQPWSVMCAYNKLYGEYCSENKELLSDILREQFDFEGFVVTDWGAVNDRVKGLEAGTELEMPASGGLNDQLIVDAVKEGKLEEKILDRAVERLLRIVLKADHSKEDTPQYDKKAHHRLARKIAGECIVLLKNEENILPLRPSQKIAVIGEMAKQVRFQGGGSSKVNPTFIDVAIDEMAQYGSHIEFSEGYYVDSDELDQARMDAAIKSAAENDVAVIFAGLPERYESEGYDRAHMKLPDNQLKLIEQILAVQPNTVVVLANGAPVVMPFAKKAKGIITMYLSGQAAGGAIADVLFGAVNPSGKLPESYPIALEHNPSYLNFPGDGKTVHYNEDVFVGYRYYDTKKIPVRFCFGHGLSYTKFQYSDLQISADNIKDTGILEVSCKIKNIGPVEGKEVVQLYVHSNSSSVMRPARELRGFKKVSLEKGEEKTVSFTLKKRDFAYFNENINDWYVESGSYTIQIGSSLQDIRLQIKVTVESTRKLHPVYEPSTPLYTLIHDERFPKLAKEVVSFVTLHSGLKMNELNEQDREFAVTIIENLPLKSLPSYTKGEFTHKDLQQLLDRLNNE